MKLAIQSIDDLINDMRIGMDINIAYGDQRFYIGSGDNNDVLIACLSADGNPHQTFPSVDAMLDSYYVDGQPLRRRLPDMFFYDC